MNFREELRKKKYKLPENKEVKVILKQILRYFHKERLKKDNFEIAEFCFRYRLRSQIITVSDLSINDGKILFSVAVSNVIVFHLLREKFIDENYQVSSDFVTSFSVLIKP